MTSGEVLAIVTAIGLNTKAIEAQTVVWKELVSFLVGPEYTEQDFGTAEQDKIDDSSGVYNLHDQAKEDILNQWRKDGYPDEVFKYFEQRP